MENNETKKEENKAISDDEFFIMMIYVYEIFKNIKDKEIDKQRQEV